MRLRRRRGLGSGGTSGSGRGGSREPAGTGRPVPGGHRLEAGPGARATALLSDAAAFLRTPRGRWVRTAAVTAFCFAIGYLVAATWLFPAPERPRPANLVQVPSLIGLDIEEARTRAEKRGLRAAVEAEIHAERGEGGTVVAQRPLAGQLASAADTVRLTVSRGPRAVAVPPLQGLGERQAVELLEGLGFTVVSRTVRSPSAGVQGTRPAAGEVLALPAEVELLVGAGPQVVVVPDLRGLHIDDVEPRLNDVGLQLGAVRFDPDAPQAPGRVVAQSPPPGYSRRVGGSVSVEVAGRPGEV